MNSTPETIISLATIPDRIADIRDTLESLIAQKLPVHLWAVRKVARSETVIDAVPEWITDMGVVAHMVDDIGPATKLVYALEDGYKRVITADDDCVYGDGWAAGLIAAAEANPDCVVGYIGRVLRGDHYMDSEWISRSNRIRRVDILCGVGGVLHDAAMIDAPALRAKANRAPTADDIAAAAHYSERGAPMLVIPGGSCVSQLPRRQCAALQNENHKRLNDVAMAELGMNRRQKLAVIMAAYRSDEWIMEMVRSFQGQEACAGWEYSLVIGVDGCEATSAMLNQHRVPHYRTAGNVGAYVLRNSLISTVDADAYCIFDADDVMLPGYLAEMCRLIDKTGLAAPRWRYEAYMSEPSNSNPRRYGEGAQPGFDWYCLHRAIGAFRPDRVDSDWDAVKRARLLGYKCGAMTNPYYVKRKHGGALTQDPETDKASAYRAAIKADHERRRNAGGLTVPMVTTPLEHVDGDWSAAKECGQDIIDAVILHQQQSGRDIAKVIAGLRDHAIGLRDIYVIGGDPETTSMRHVPCDDPLPCREANMIRKVLAACQNTEISDPFLLCANDEILIADIDMKEYPLHVSEPKQTGRYAQRVANTRTAIEEQGWPWAYYDGHIPIMIRKTEYIEAMHVMPWDAPGAGILCRTPYGCLVASRGAKAIPAANAKHEADPNAFVVAADGPPPPPKRISRRQQRRAALEGAR